MESPFKKRLNEVYAPVIKKRRRDNKFKLIKTFIFSFLIIVPLAIAFMLLLLKGFMWVFEVGNIARVNYLIHYVKYPLITGGCLWLLTYVIHGIVIIINLKTKHDSH